MRFAFLLPNYSGCVVGSLLVYYRFAQHLSSQGHSVDLFHPLQTSPDTSFLERLRLRLTVSLRNAQPHPVRWIRFPRGVRPRFRTLLAGLDLDHDKVIAFSWRAIDCLDAIRAKGDVYGYIVEYEAWSEAEEVLRQRMESAYRKPIPLLSSSKVVLEMLTSVGAPDPRLCVHGVDMPLQSFPLKSPKERDARRVGFPVRIEPVKSPEILQETVRKLKALHGQDVVLWGFGSEDIPKSIVETFDEYYVSPSDAELHALYGNSAIFAVPSRKEGFGMPAAEAMAHGCAVVSVDNGGVRTYGIPGENCLLVPPNSSDALVEAITMLLKDPEQRSRLATTAPRSVRFLDWSEAGDRFVRSIGL